MNEQEDYKVAIPYKDNFFEIKKFGIYDFYKISLRHGETPAFLKDQYFTHQAYAETAVKNYIDKMEKASKPKKTVSE